MFRAIVFFGLITSAFASATLDVLVNAAASFSATIQQQLEMLQSRTRQAAEIADLKLQGLREDGPYFNGLTVLKTRVAFRDLYRFFRLSA